jgi:hypothetical protein
MLWTHRWPWRTRSALVVPLRQRPPLAARSRPRLETLEGRCLPSTVTNLSDHDPGSLRDAIATTPAGGTVDFQAGLIGTISLTTGELAIAKNLTISGPGASVISVSGHHASRVFNISGTVTISGLTAADGTSFTGGGIYNGGNFTLANSIISDNTAAFGGGIENGFDSTGCMLTVTNSIISGNRADMFAGGIGNGYTSTGCLATINQSTISDNMSIGNGDSNYGGGIGNGGIGDGGNKVTVINSTVSGNAAINSGQWFGYGGGIFNLSGTVAVINSTISGNTATNSTLGYYGYGGGIGNGGISSYGPRPMVTVTDSTISGNTAGSDGGGVFNNGGDPFTTTYNSIIAGNIGGSNHEPNDVHGDMNSQGHNLIGNGDGGSGFVPTDLVGTYANPIDPKLGPLQDNGGPTRTMAPLPSSPAIDAGDPTDAPPTDQRGLPRFLDGTMDIGAVELRVFHVTSTADSGPESLRQAILDANDTPGTNGIAFALGGGGVQTIAPTSPLPAVTNPVEIDGATQAGYAGLPLIELAGEGAGPGADGLTLASPNSTVTGLVIGGFDGAGVSISGNGNRVVGNFIGTDATGTMVHPNWTGVTVVYIGSDNLIGGTEPRAGNLISGNLLDGVGMYGGAGNQIQGNLIGTDASGTAALPNSYGVELYSGSYNSVVGGGAAGAGNLISGNVYDGIGIYSDGNTVHGNRIGIDETGTAPLGNGRDGVAVLASLHGYENAIGGTDPGAGNTIAYNGGYGVRITTGAGEAIHQNSIYANAAGGIVLLSGGNQNESAPDLTSAVAGVGTVTVVGTVTGTPGAKLVVEFFANTVCDPSGYGQGERFVGSTTVVVGPDGEASFTDILDGTVDVGQFITATATDPAGNTSPFSNCVEVKGADTAGGRLNGEAVSSGSVTPIPVARNSDSPPAATQAQPLPSEVWANQVAPIEATVPPVPMTMVLRAQDAVFEAWDTVTDRLALNWP